MAREIHCHKCNKYLGEIRDAKLAKGIAYVCGQCKKEKGFDSFIENLMNGKFKG